MSYWTLAGLSLAGALSALVTGSAPVPIPVGPKGYSAATATVASTPAADSVLEHAAGFRALRGALAGRMSIAGLPPVYGTLELTRETLVFRQSGNQAPIYYPLYHQVRRDSLPATRRPAVTLMTVELKDSAFVYLFHLDGAVFETSAPGMLKDLVDNPAWLDSLGPRRWSADLPLVNPADESAMATAVADLAASSFADSLFQLFGRPARPIGLIGSKGKAQGRLGEYIGSRDSLSLAPDRMISQDQMRHGLAHELAHRWQRKDPRTLKAIWRDVPEIGDSLRYGYGSDEEHQAEAIAFAVHYLQTTTAPGFSHDERLDLLDAYERLVPGTRIITRHLLTRTLYAQHPLVVAEREGRHVAQMWAGCRLTNPQLQRTSDFGRRCPVLLPE